MKNYIVKVLSMNTGTEEFFQCEAEDTDDAIAQAEAEYEGDCSMDVFEEVE